MTYNLSLFVSVRKKFCRLVLSPQLQSRSFLDELSRERLWNVQKRKTLVYKVCAAPDFLIVGTLRSPTATSTKTSSQNINLLYHKSLVIIPSRLRHTLLAKYPENELVREILRWRFSVACSRCRQNLKFGGFTSSLCRGSQKYLLKSVRHV